MTLMFREICSVSTHTVFRNIALTGDMPLLTLSALSSRKMRNRCSRGHTVIPQVLAAKVQTEIDKLVLAGILRRSYSNWSSPLLVIDKADGRSVDA